MEYGNLVVTADALVWFGAEASKAGLVAPCIQTDVVLHVSDGVLGAGGDTELGGSDEEV